MSNYNMELYEVMEELGETQEQIDEVNHEVKNAYMGMWQGAIELCHQFKHQLQGVDTSFIDDELVKVWQGINSAYQYELIDDEELSILQEKEEYHKLDHKENE